ncbi:MAG: hypothetical protein ABSD31_16995 [Candidatus Binataceae bacterium]|jgi:hypothetical protein
MARFKLLVSLLVLVGVCSLAAPGFAKVSKCKFNGDYSFFFWTPAENAAGVGYFSVTGNTATNCRLGTVLPGGILNCDAGGTEYEDYIEGGSVFLESDGEGTMEIETNSSDGICGTGTNALELDISVVLKGKSVLFNSDGERYASSGTTPQAGYFQGATGRADKCFAGQIAGCYNAAFWTPDDPVVANCTICVNGAGGITGGSCACNRHVDDDTGNTEYLSEIETGGYTLGENCQSSTGYMWFQTSSDPICGETSALALDFAVAEGGLELLGACDPAEYILGNTSLPNTGFYDACVFEGSQQ